MNAPEKMSAVIGGKRYSCATATLLAGNDYWDGNNWERRGTNCFLYRTPRGAYFAVHLSQWQGSEPRRFEPLDQSDALSLYESLREKRVEAEEAFPGVKIEEA